MQIVCPTCATRYEVSAFSIGADGRSVRCARCRAIWLALPTADSVEAVAGDAALAAFQAEFRNGAPLETSAPAATAMASEGDHPIDLDAGRPPLVIDETPTAEALQENGRPAEVQSLAARRRRQQGHRPPSPKIASRRLLPLVIVALLGIIGALIGWRGEVVRHAPQMASLYAAIGMPVNLRKLVFTDVRMTQETRDGVPVLLLQGTILSTSPTPTTVPRLRFAVRNEAGAELHSWTAPPPQPKLAPFESLAFETRLASPSANGRNIVVRFFNRHDAVASLH